jgi:integrase
MPKPRLADNKGLPARWRFTHGAYYYCVPPGLEPQWDGKQMFRLGKALPDAYAVYAKRIDTPAEGENIGQLLDRYALQVVPTKAPKTQTENIRYIRKLRSVFGHMKLRDLEPHHVYKYVDKRDAKTAAHREIEVLSHALTKAVEWGAIKNHPFKGEVRLEGSAHRDRYVDDWEVLECLALPSTRARGSVAMIQAYIRLKLLTGLSRSDLLRLRMGEHIRDDGIHVTRHKAVALAATRKKKTAPRATIYTYEKVPERRSAVAECMGVRPVLSPFLFCNRRGEGYFNEATGTCNGFDSMWGRFMDRVMKETKVTQRFTEHDLRAKAGSDAASLEAARALLQHASATTTQAIYRRKPEKV